MLRGVGDTRVLDLPEHATKAGQSTAIVASRILLAMQGACLQYRISAA